MRADLQDRGRRRADKNRQIGTDRRGVPAYHPDVPRAFPYHRGIGRCIARIPLHVSSSHPRILTSRQESKGFAMSARSFASFVLMLLLAACGGDSDSSVPGSAAAAAAARASQAAAWKPLVPGTSWQWQIDGNTINETVLDRVNNPRKMFDVDMEQTDAATIQRLKAKGITVVCYMETGGREDGRSDANRFPDSVLGNPVEGYEDHERWLDIRQTTILMPLMLARLDRAKKKGCDGIEPDLDDSYRQETGFPLTRDDQLRYNTALIAAAHDRGMSMGLKNGSGIATAMAKVADWALNEQCNRFHECDGYASFIALNKAVFNVEYTRPDGMTLADFCPADNRANFDGILKWSSDTLAALPRAACRFE
ncbi:endo alpha-1,4 polygalactosaminidase [Burkholderia arboris]|uniref:endo alpha-1,4 polygalactosaminidase n=1 Tax=Burkholderia arboris TaxID=488730 RepID=UPI00158E3DD1|nr:endo alpha-1,4 polygalactosaminidase [Burkholderia arboris]